MFLKITKMISVFFFFSEAEEETFIVKIEFGT